MSYYINDELAPDLIAGEEKRVREARAHRAELRAVFSTPKGARVLRRLATRFEIDLPVFQGKRGQYDALDAMRRDAHREVFLYIFRQMDLADGEASHNNNNNNND